MNPFWETEISLVDTAGIFGSPAWYCECGEEESMNDKDPIEWEFGVPSSQVSLERLHYELCNLPAIYAYSYIEQLRSNAPTVYGRLREWARKQTANGMPCLTWIK